MCLSAATWAASWMQCASPRTQPTPALPELTGGSDFEEPVGSILKQRQCLLIRHSLFQRLVQLLPPLGLQTADRPHVR